MEDWGKSGVCYCRMNEQEEYSFTRTEFQDLVGSPNNLSECLPPI